LGPPLPDGQNTPLYFVLGFNDHVDIFPGDLLVRPDAYVCDQLEKAWAEFDLSVVRCQARSLTGLYPGLSYGWLPVDSDYVASEGEEVLVIHQNCVQTPYGECVVGEQPTKKVSHGVVSAVNADGLQYDCDGGGAECVSIHVAPGVSLHHDAQTLPGSSGAAVLRLNPPALIAIHDGGSVQSKTNFAVTFRGMAQESQELADWVAALPPPSAPIEDPTPLRWSVFSDGTVLDLETGIVWAQETAPKASGLSEAELYCAELILGGRSDWRLPVVDELTSIVTGCERADVAGHCAVADPTCLDLSCWTAAACGPCSSKSEFADTAAFWASETWKGAPGRYLSASPIQGSLVGGLWVVDFATGGIMNAAATGASHVRCVTVGAPQCTCQDKDGDGFMPVDCQDDNCLNRMDCNDEATSVNPAAEDLCGNGVDEDCDGADAKCD
jgi:hypothetical protein